MSSKPNTPSKLHWLVPASGANVELCYNLASGAANRYPVPMVLGFNGTGLFDASVTHLAKLRAIQVYLNNLEKADDDDLILIVDGYDIIMQLPPSVMIERYFDLVARNDARIAKRYGISIKEVHKQGMRNTVFWGPDKICWPFGGNEPRCWAVPTSGLPSDAFGPKSGNGEMFYNDPRWLNSGTVIGPTEHVRALVNATMAEIDATYDEDYQWKDSDQFYIANIWGRQEYYRSLKMAGWDDDDVEGGPSDRHTPKNYTEEELIEMHIGIDYESSLFQTKAGYEPFFGYLEFNSSGLNGKMTRDMFEEGSQFTPYNIPMPANVFSALARLYESVADSQAGVTAGEWIRGLPLGVNFVTQHIYGLWHCTASKEWIAGEYTKLWFYPLARSLVKATVRAFSSGELITEHRVDGRQWAPRYYYPDDLADMDDELGGAYTDYDGGNFMTWGQICGDFEEELFKGEDGLQARHPISVHQGMLQAHAKTDDSKE